MTSRITKLNQLDFSPGIRASDINENFELLKRWIEEERLRVAGWGIVEGFELSKDLDNFTISVGKGILIDKNGAHLEIPSKTFNGFELDHEYGLRPRTTSIEETITVSESGLVKLQYPIYSEDTTRPEFTYKIVYYESGRLPSDLEIIDEDSKNPLTRNDVDTIAASEIFKLWCSSYLDFKPLIISIVSSIDGSSIITGWNLLSNAESFSIYFLYSSEVVAPIT